MYSATSSSRAACTSTSEACSKRPEIEVKANHSKNNDQEGRRPHYDLIPMSYAQLLPILVNDGAIVPKQIELARFPYGRKHDPCAICGYHVGYVGHSTETCHVLKARVQELIDQKLLSFTPVITEAPIEKRFEYKDPPIHVQIHPPVVQRVTQYPNQGYHPGMLLAYPRASYSTVVAPRYTYTGAPYVPFGSHHG